eukprot:PhF_6_TR40406/c0_g1_i2/m.60210
MSVIDASLLSIVYVPTAAVHISQGIAFSILPAYTLTALSGTNYITVGLILATFPLGKYVMEHYLLPLFLDEVKARRARYAQLAFLLYGAASLLAWWGSSVFSLMTAATTWGAAAALYTHVRGLHIEYGIQVQSIFPVLHASDVVGHVGLFIGAVVGGAVFEYISPTSPMFLMLACSLGAVGALMWCGGVVDENNASSSAASSQNRQQQPQTHQAQHSATSNTTTYVTVFLVLLLIARSARRFVVPVSGKDVAMSQTTIGFCIGVAYLLEGVGSYYLESLRDKFGHRALMVAPCVLLMLGYFAMASVRSNSAVMVGAILQGIAAGISAGYIPSHEGLTVSKQRQLSDLCCFLGPLTAAIFDEMSGGSVSATCILLGGVFAGGAWAWLTVFLPNAGTATMEEGVAFSHIDLYNGYEEVA